MTTRLYCKVGYSLLVMLISLTSSCLEEENTCFKCLYEKRKSGCNNYAYGGWESGELLADKENIKSGLSKQDYCNLVYPSSSSSCAGTCCVSYNYRNVKVASCP